MLELYKTNLKDIQVKDIRLRAEWEKQVAILMAFPHKRSDWAVYIQKARECFIDIIEQILRFESVILCVDTEDNEGAEILRTYFAQSSYTSHNTPLSNTQPLQSYIATYLNTNIPQESFIQPYLRKFHTQSPYVLHIMRVRTNDTWARDFSALGIESAGEHKLIKCTFNGWGLKYPSQYDNAIIEQIFNKEHIIKVDMVLEGGSIESNGAGVLLTNTQCLLEKNRNPHLSQAEIESRLKTHFGLKEVLWLHNGYLAGDDTDSHIDTLARFVSKESIAYITCEDRQDEHFEALARMKEELENLKQPNGKPYKLIPLPFTQAIYDEQNNRLPASYANFLFVNGALLVPTYGDANDTKALAILARALPQYRVVGVDCRSLILWHGSLHCISMQLYGD